MKAFSAVVASRNPIGCWEDTSRFNQILQEKYPESFRDEKILIEKRHGPSRHLHGQSLQ